MKTEISNSTSRHEANTLLYAVAPTPKLSTDGTALDGVSDLRGSGIGATSKDCLRVLVACEYSGTVRDAFSKLGHDAWSCDLLPTESLLTQAEGKHIQGDVISILNDGWDLLVGHPPCNYISYAGVHVWNKPGRVFKRLEALNFFAQLWEAPIPHICLENPKSCASPTIAKYSQEIQPYYFGDSQIKTTWLWLKNLPPLTYSFKQDLFNQQTSCERPEPIEVHLRKEGGINKAGSLKKRYYTDAATRNPKERARFWPTVASAMAEQWSNYVIKKNGANV